MVKRSSRNLHRAANLQNAQGRVGHQLSRHFNLFRRKFARSAALSAAGAGGEQSGSGAFPNQLALEFRQRTKNMRF